MALFKPFVGPAKITALAVAAVTILGAVPPLVAEMTMRHFGLLAGVNFLALQLGTLWSLRKSSPVYRMRRTANGRCGLETRRLR